MDWYQAASDPADGFGTFHMYDFEHSKEQFAGWPEDKKQRVLSRILAIIGKYALRGFITAVVKEDYDRIVSGKLREKLGNYHYTFAIQSCLSYIEEWFKKEIRQPYEPVEYAFDRMSQGQHEIVDLFNDLIRFDQAKHFGIEVGGWSFQNKAYFLPLQAADIIAWEGRRYMVDCQLPETPQTTRSSFKSLIDHPMVDARFFHKENLPAFAEEVSAWYEKMGWENSPRGGFGK